MSERIVAKDFYVYLHRKATTGEVFYVGKGAGRRAWRQCDRSEFWKRIAKKHGVIVEIHLSGLQEWYAFELEKQLIAYYGLAKLANITEGGEGVGGINAGKPLSEQRRKKVSESLKGHFVSDATRLRQSISKIGIKQSPEHIKNRMAGRSIAAKKGLLQCKKGKKVMHCSGFVFTSSNNARRWLEQFGGISTSSAGFCTAIKSGKPYKGHLFT